MTSGLISSRYPVESGTAAYGAASTYSIVTGGKEASDPYLKNSLGKLFDGKTDETVSSGGSSYENIKIHFDKVMQAEGVCVYTTPSATYGIAAYASMGDENYEFSAGCEATADSDGKIYLALPGRVYATDLKVVIKAADGAELAVSEIEAYGKPAEESRVRVTSYEYDTQVPFVTDRAFIAMDTDKTLNNGQDAAITSSGDYVSVIYNLGRYSQVEEVKVYGSHGGLELLTSPDGQNYFSCGYFAEENGVTEAFGRAENNAKYAKLVFRKGSGAISLSEIELYARLVQSTAFVVHNTMPIEARVTLKPNNIMYIDWSDYNGAENGVSEYKVYIESTKFKNILGLTPKSVYVGGSSESVTKTSAQFATYAGLAPDTTYYVAVAPANGETTSVAPVKITTYGTDGGDNAAAIFGVNEYEEAGGARAVSREEAAKYSAASGENITEEDISALPSGNGSIDNVRKLLGDLEIVQKNRHFNSGDANLKPYLARGISWLPEGVGDDANVKRLNGLGVYTFGHANEPEITSTYKGQPEKFGSEFSQAIKEVKETLSTASTKSVLYSPTLCGSAYYEYIEALYDAEPDMKNLYDVCDVHMYSKGIGEPSEEYITGAERTDVPERIFKKVERLKNVLAVKGDEKPIVSTETGWTSSSKAAEETWGGVALETTQAKKAEYVPRMFLSSIMAGLDEVYLYAFQNQGYLTNSEVAEGKTYIQKKWIDGGYRLVRMNPSHQHQYGIVDWYGNPYEGYFSFYTLGKILRDTYYVRAHDLGELVYGAEFYDRAKDKYVTALWEISGKGASVNVTAESSTLKKLDMYGNASYVATGTTALTTAPIYLYSDAPLGIFVN